MVVSRSQVVLVVIHWQFAIATSLDVFGRARRILLCVSETPEKLRLRSFGDKFLVTAEVEMKEVN